MKAKIEITSVVHDSFEGVVNSSELSQAFKTKHGIQDDTELLLGGDIAVDWDDDLPLPAVNFLELAIRLPNSDKWVSIDSNELDIDSVDDVLASYDFSEWYEDRAASLADNPYFDLER